MANGRTGVIGGERFVGAAARASGGEAHDCLTETFAAVPLRRLYTSGEIPPVKFMKVSSPRSNAAGSTVGTFE
jgi:hypothetical protein